MDPAVLAGIHIATRVVHHIFHIPKTSVRPRCDESGYRTLSLLLENSEVCYKDYHSMYEMVVYNSKLACFRERGNIICAFIVPKRFHSQYQTAI